MGLDCQEETPAGTPRKFLLPFLSVIEKSPRRNAIHATAITTFCTSLGAIFGLSCMRRDEAVGDGGGGYATLAP